MREISMNIFDDVDTVGREDEVDGMLDPGAMASGGHGAGSGFTSTMPNVYGGLNVMGSGGMHAWTNPNVHGGSDVHWSDGHVSVGVPNVHGGTNWHDQ